MQNMGDNKVPPPSYNESEGLIGGAQTSSQAFHPYYGAPPQPTYGVPPQPTYVIPPQPAYAAPTYGATATTVIVTPPDVVVIGACPACRVGVLEDDFTVMGVLCAILFFPLGVLCCLAMKEKKCRNCGAQFG
ncbi:uncharacterized protein LOC143204317 [Rhynchophorus ferrugineus]